MATSQTYDRKDHGLSKMSESMKNLNLLEGKKDAVGTKPKQCEMNSQNQAYKTHRVVGKPKLEQACGVNKVQINKPIPVNSAKVINKNPMQKKMNDKTKGDIGISNKNNSTSGNKFPIQNIEDCSWVDIFGDDEFYDCDPRDYVDNEPEYDYDPTDYFDDDDDSDYHRWLNETNYRDACLFDSDIESD